MDNDLIVFQEGTCCFGVFFQEFDLCLPLGKVDVFPSPESNFLWRFQSKDSDGGGVFVHLGALLGDSRVNLSQSGRIFLKKAPGETFPGVLANNFRMKIPRGKIANKNIIQSRFKPGVPDIVNNCFRIMLRYRYRNIFIIEPQTFFESLGLAPKSGRL